MGRKSLLKSTTKKKKKSTAKSKAASKKSVKASAPKKVVVKQGATEKTAAVAAKKAALKKAPAKKAAPKANTKKAPAKKKKMTLKELVFKQFDMGKKAPPVSIKKKAVKLPEAPPLVSGYDKKETARIRAMLFQKFDLKTSAPAKAVQAKKAAPKKAPAKKKKVTLKELVFKQFDMGKKATPVSIKKKAVKLPEAPPLVSGYNDEDTERIRALLLKIFELKGEASPTSVQEGLPSKTETTAPPVAADSPPYQPPASVSSAGADQMGKALKLGLGALALLMILIIGTSFSNRSKFYLKEVNGAVEVWRGKFAPAGTELVQRLDGMKVPNPIRESYTKKEINPILFGFFQNKADGVLNAPMGPDIAEMKAHLRRAVSYAPSAESGKTIQRRLKSIDFILAFHKADVALGKGTLPDLKTAKASLATAYSFASTDSQRELVVQTQDMVNQAIAEMKK